MIAPGTIVLTQDGWDWSGVVLADAHPLPDWVWVEWEHLGRCDEHVSDVTIVS